VCMLLTGDAHAYAPARKLGGVNAVRRQIGGVGMRASMGKQVLPMHAHL